MSYQWEIGKEYTCVGETKPVAVLYAKVIDLDGIWYFGRVGSTPQKWKDFSAVDGHDEGLFNNEYGPWNILPPPPPTIYRWLPISDVRGIDCLWTCSGTSIPHPNWSTFDSSFVGYMLKTTCGSEVTYEFIPRKDK